MSADLVFILICVLVGWFITDFERALRGWFRHIVYEETKRVISEEVEETQGSSHSGPLHRESRPHRSE